MFGEQYQNFERIIILLSDITQKKYVNDETGAKLANLISSISKDQTFGP